MFTVTHHSAKAQLIRATTPGGAAEIVFSGLIDLAAFTALRAGMIDALAGVSAAVVRLDRAALVLSEPLRADPSIRRFSTVIAFVVKEAHLAGARIYCEELAAQGTTCAAFSDSPEQMGWAYEWARLWAAEPAAKIERPILVLQPLARSRRARSDALQEFPA